MKGMEVLTYIQYHEMLNSEDTYRIQTKLATYSSPLLRTRDINENRKVGSWHLETPRFRMFYADRDSSGADTTYQLEYRKEDKLGFDDVSQDVKEHATNQAKSSRVESD